MVSIKRFVGSNPTPCTSSEPTTVNLINFALWLKRKGNRDSTIERKLKYLKALNGSIEDMFVQVLSKPWSDKSKECALEAIEQYAEFLGFKVSKPNFKAYNNNELYVPNPQMVKQLIYRIRSLQLRTAVMIAVETGASASEAFNLKWSDINLESRTIKITGVKGHRTNTYTISQELATLLSQLPKMGSKVFKFKTARYMND